MFEFLIHFSADSMILLSTLESIKEEMNIHVVPVEEEQPHGYDGIVLPEIDDALATKATDSAKVLVFVPVVVGKGDSKKKNSWRRKGSCQCSSYVSNAHEDKGKKKGLPHKYGEDEFTNGEHPKKLKVSASTTIPDAVEMTKIPLRNMPLPRLLL